MAEKKSNKSFIAIGSNLNHPLQQVKNAVKHIDAIEQCEVVQCSNWVSSYAVGPGNQPDFINGVVEICTQLMPLELLHQLQIIEDLANRQRVVRWGPRTLDLDILLYNNEIITSEVVTVPHPHMCERDFVIIPLMSIVPNLVFPSGESIASVANKLSINQGRTANCWPLLTSQ